MTRETRHELVQALVRRDLRLHQLPDHLDADEVADIRREALAIMTGASLDHMGHYSLDADRVSHRNCENFIGVAQVPIGVVGPVPIRGEHAEGDFWVPMATTEAALVASTNRGCAAIRAAGGATVRVEDVGMTRAPSFRTSGIEQTGRFLNWIRDNEDRIRERCEQTSQYLKLLDIRPTTFGSTVFLRFRFHSGDAMGMNMATIACDRVVLDMIEPETGVECIALSGNYCVDKKPASINFHEGRGKRIYAEAVIEGPVLKRTLKTTARQLVEVQYRKNLLGSIAAGSQGFNAHYANLIAAFFLATGQDPAHVVEGSIGVTCLEQRGPEAIFASIYLPDMPLGAVGGGTPLATQSEAMAMLGIEADSSRPGVAAMKLAEILGAVVLAGELSLLAAFTSNDLARAHERLSGRTDSSI